MCIKSGIPLWVSCYPPSSKDTDTLISGFLSAVNTFAQETSGNYISTMTVGNTLWSFTSLYHLEDFFLACKIDVSGFDDARKYKIKLNEQLVSEIVTTFQKYYPQKIFVNTAFDSTSFADFQSLVDTKIQEMVLILNRYEKRNKSWLAEFGHFDKLIMALLNHMAIVFTVDKIEHFYLSDELLTLQATLESFLGMPIKKIEYIAENFEQLEEKAKLEKIFLIESKYTQKIYSGPFTIVDMTSRTVIKGPDPNSNAMKISEMVKKNSIQHKNVDEIDLVLNNAPILDTEFPCRVCFRPIKFNIQDEKSYLNKKDNQLYGQKLVNAYRVGHIVDGIMHVNVVLVDQRGIFCTITDGFALEVTDSKASNTSKSHLSLFGNEIIEVKPHYSLEGLAVLNVEKKWIMDIIRAAELHTPSFGSLFYDTWRESYIHDANPPDSGVLTLLNKKYHFWMAKPYIIVACIKQSEIVDIIDAFVKKIFMQNFKDNEWLEMQKRLNFALQSAGKGPLKNDSIANMYQILFNDIVYMKMLRADREKKLKMPTPLPPMY